MRGIDKAAVVNKQPRFRSIHKLKKDELIKLLKKYGLKTNVTVSEGRKLLSKCVSSKKEIKLNEPILEKEDQLNEDIFEMDGTDSICFVCDQMISSDNWKYKLLETASKKRNVPVADLIKQLVGSEFAVLVGERDVVCSGCMNLLNLMDDLTAQLDTVQSTLSRHIFSKYNLESDSTKPISVSNEVVPQDHDDIVKEVVLPSQDISDVEPSLALELPDEPGNGGRQRREVLSDTRGYTYCVNRTIGNIKYLRCSKYYNGCLGRAILRDGKIYSQVIHLHNHAVDSRRVAVRKFTSEMIREAGNMQGRNMMELYHSVAERFPLEAKFTTYNAARRAVTRFYGQKFKKTKSTYSIIVDDLNQH